MDEKLTLEKSAKTVEEAVAAALEELGINAEEAQVEVVEEPKSGLFGLGSKLARVRVSRRLTPAEEIRRMAEDLFRLFEPACTLTLSEREGAYHIAVSGSNPGRVIGKHGETINSLQFLLSVLLARKGIHARLILDTDNYREKREQTLQDMAKGLADRVRRLHRSYTMPPLPAMERRVIHLTLQDRNDVATHSEGEEPFRKVIIEPTQAAKANHDQSSSPRYTPPSPLTPTKKWMPPVRRRSPLTPHTAHRYAPPRKK